MGSRPGCPTLHEHHLLRDPGAPELHEVRAAGHRVLEVAVEAGGLRAAAARPGALPGDGERAVHGVRRRLLGSKPHAVLVVPLVQGKD